MNRLRELDFLRGLAILFVLVRHKELFAFTKKMGWIGVDLFFVLSGFLVSGLFFREFQKYGNVKPGRFLVRRGFKIYPIYYLFYPLYFIPVVIDEGFQLKGFLADMFFFQNYVSGWGYTNEASWSLAIEEHFYFGFALILWFCLKKNWVRLTPDNTTNKPSQVEWIIFSLMILCLGMRIASNLLFPHHTDRNFTMTHLRIDSLSAGVLIAYLYYFRLDYLKNFYFKYKTYLLIAVPLLMAFTPFIEPIPSFFVKTIGFPMLYTAFGIVLVHFLLSTKINERLNKVFTKPVVNLVSKIGFCSYSIYIIHVFVIRMMEKANIHLNHFLEFLIFSVISISLGMLMTYYVEKYFLKIRDKYYPARSNG